MWHNDVLCLCLTTNCSNQINLANLSGGCSSKESHNHSSSDDESDTDDETATRDLNSWRAAVSNATSAAQLSIYVSQLVRCIAWEKSIMKVVRTDISCYYLSCLAHYTIVLYRILLVGVGLYCRVVRQFTLKNINSDKVYKYFNLNNIYFILICPELKKVFRSSFGLYQL